MVRLRTLLVPALLGLGLAGGCDRTGEVDEQEVRSTAREAGQELQDAAEKAGDVAQDAAQAGVEATKEAAAKAEDALDGDDHAAARDTVVRPPDTLRQ
jgi:hypothetical protein